MDAVTYILCKSSAKKYTDQVTQSLMGGVHYRGSVSYYTDLPNDASEGDSYTVKYAGTSGSVADGTEYTWGYDTDTQNYTWISFSKDAYLKAEIDILLGGKQDTIDSTHKLSADNVDDADSTNKFTNATEKQTWNGKQDALSHAQMDAANSGIDSAKVAQIATNTSDISAIQQTIGNINAILEEVL